MIKEKIQNSVKDLVVESSLSRVWQHINDPDRSFAIVSAYLDQYSESENQERHVRLQNRVRSLGYGYIELDSGYSYVEEEGERVFAEEQSLMVPEIRKSEAMELAQEFEQQSILFKQGTNFVLLGTREDVGIGKVMMSFETGPDNLTFDSETVQDAFSALASGSDKFAFVAERAIKDFPTRMVQREAEKVKGDWVVIFDNT